MPWSPRRVVVPIDFSPHSEHALDEAAARLAHDGRIELIYVLEHLSALHPAMVWETDDDAERLDHAAAALRRLGEAHGLEDFGVTTTTSLGNPAMAVARFAEQCEADAIVVSSHGRTGLARVALGSVAERIVRYARCPVLVIKPTRDQLTG